MSIYQKLLGLPAVYNIVRPLVVGGIEMGGVFSHLSVEPGDTVFDVGCGTGIALNYLPPFRRYVGYDTDPEAIEAARTRAKKRAGNAGEPEVVEFEARHLGLSDVQKGAPEVVILAGVLHHLSDADAVDLLALLRESPKLRQVLTLDVTFFPGKLFNNVLSVLDRGQYPRHPGGYEVLAERAGFELPVSQAQAAGPKSKVSYWLMSLSPRR